MNSLLPILVFLALGAGVYFFVIKRKKSPQSPQSPSATPAPLPQAVPLVGNPWTIGPVFNGQNFSAGMPAQPTQNPDGTFSFDFPLAPPGVHGLLRPVVEPYRNQIQVAFNITGNPQFIEVDTGGNLPTPGAIRIFLQRRGDDWGGPNTGKSSYRFYSSPTNLAPGDGSVRVSLLSKNFTNVDGQHDEQGFLACLADLETVGLAFGGRFAMHGLYANSPSTFLLQSYTVA